MDGLQLRFGLLRDWERERREGRDLIATHVDLLGC
jgi:hypothetical protein